MSDGLQQIFKNPIELNLERFKYRHDLLIWRDFFGDWSNFHNSYWDMIAEYFTHK